MDERTQKMLERIAKIIMKYEDPTGTNCSNNVGCLISIDDDKFSFNGEKFVPVKG